MTYTKGWPKPIPDAFDADGVPHKSTRVVPLSDAERMREALQQIQDRVAAAADARIAGRTTEPAALIEIDSIAFCAAHPTPEQGK